MATQPSMPSASEIINAIQDNNRFFQDFQAEVADIFAEEFGDNLESMVDERMVSMTGDKKWRRNPEMRAEADEVRRQLTEQLAARAEPIAEQRMRDRAEEAGEEFVPRSQREATQTGLMSMAETMLPIAALESLGFDTAADRRASQAERDVQRFEPSLPARDRARATELAGMTEGEFTDSLDERSTEIRQRQQFESLQQEEAAAQRMVNVAEEAMAAMESPEAMRAFLSKIESIRDPQLRLETASDVSQLDGFDAVSLLGEDASVRVIQPDGSTGYFDFMSPDTERQITSDMPDGEQGWDPGESRGESRRWSLGEAVNNRNSARGNREAAEAGIRGEAAPVVAGERPLLEQTPENRKFMEDSIRRRERSIAENKPGWTDGGGPGVAKIALQTGGEVAKNIWGGATKGVDWLLNLPSGSTAEGIGGSVLRAGDAMEDRYGEGGGVMGWLSRPMNESQRGTQLRRGAAPTSQEQQEMAYERALRARDAGAFSPDVQMTEEQAERLRQAEQWERSRRG